MPTWPIGQHTTDPIIRPLRASVVPLRHGTKRPVALVDLEHAAVLEIHPGTPDIIVLDAVIDLLYYTHPTLLRQWINPFGFGAVSLADFVQDWPRLTAGIAGIVATPDAIPPELHP